MTVPLRTVRIFISSPGDVAEERSRARDVIEGLRKRYAGKLQLQPLLWEDFGLTADKSFQAGIEAALEKLEKDGGIDVAVFIVWSRIGTPLEPRLAKSDGTDLTGTEREFHLMSEAFQRRGRPAILVYTRHDDPRFWERMSKISPATHEAFVEITQKQRAEGFIQEFFYDAERKHNLRAHLAYSGPSTFSSRLRSHLTFLLDQLAGESFLVGWDIDVQGPPYLGLNAYDEKHSQVFFGREDESLEARRALREQAAHGCAFLLLTGASGSGKSSLARAGVLPDVRDCEVGNGINSWRWLIVTPAELGPSPVLGLLRKMAQPDVLPALVRDGKSLDHMAAALGAPAAVPSITEDIRLALRSLEKGPNAEVRLLLLIDQLEEIFQWSGENRQALLEFIEVLARMGPIWVLATVRSDCFAEVQDEMVLARLLARRGPMLLGRPRSDSMLRLIEGPANLAGLSFERGNPDADAANQTSRKLSEVIAGDASDLAELLPHVGYLLQQLFQHRKGTMLTFAEYNRMKGVKGALQNNLQHIYDRLPKEVRESLEKILPLLVGVAETSGDPATRLYPALSSLRQTPACAMLVDTLIESRFLVRDRRDDTPVAAFAHDSLLSLWSKVAEWIDKNRGLLRIRRRLEQPYEGWFENGRTRSDLMVARLDLEEGRKLLAEGQHLLVSRRPLNRESVRCASELSDFIEASIRLAAAKRRSRWLVGTSIALLLFGSTLFAWKQRSAAVDASSSLAGKNAELSQTNIQLGQANAGLTAANAKAAAALARSNLFVAQARWQEGRAGDAMDLLDAIPVEHRHIEWRLARREYEGSDLTLLGHNADVDFVAFSPDGTRLVSHGDDKTIKLWDAMTGQELKSYAADDPPVHCIAFGASGDHLQFGRFQGRTIFWSPALTDVVNRLDRPHNLTPGIAFSPDGELVATAHNDDGSVTIHNVDTTEILHRFPRPKAQLDDWGNAMGLAFSPDSRRLAVSPDMGSIQEWDVRKGVVVKTMEGVVPTGRFLSYSPDGEMLASTANLASTFVWNTRTGARLPWINDLSWGRVSFSPNCRWLAVPAIDSRLTLRSCLSGLDRYDLSEYRDLFGHRDTPKVAAFSPDGDRIASGSEDHAIKIWNIRHGNAQRVIRRVIGYANHGASLRLATQEEDDVVSIRDGDSPDQLNSLVGQRLSPEKVSFSNDATMIAGRDDEGQLWIWDSQQGTVRRKIAAREVSGDLFAWSPDNTRLALARSWNGPLQVWDINRGITEWKLAKDSFSDRDEVIFSPSGTFAAVTDSVLGQIRLINWSTGDKMHDLRIGPESVDVIVFNADGTALATAVDNVITLWDLRVGAELRKLRHPHRALSEADSERISSVSALEFSNDGRLLASGNRQGSVCIWALNTGDNIGASAGDRGPNSDKSVIRSLRFSEDGSRLVSCGGSGKVKIWDPKSGEELFECALARQFYRFAQKETTSVDFVLGGVMAMTSDQECHIWDGAPDLAELARAKVASPDGHSVVESWRAAKFAPDPDWHAELAQNYESISNRYAAMFHLAWLVRIRQTDPADFERLQNAHANWKEEHLTRTPESERDLYNPDGLVPRVVREMLQADPVAACEASISSLEAQANSKTRNARELREACLILEKLALFHIRRGDYDAARERHAAAIGLLQRMRASVQAAELCEREIPRHERRVAFCRDAVPATGDLTALLQMDAIVIPKLLKIRCDEFAKRGRVADVEQAAEKLRAISATAPVQLYHAACAYAACADMAVRSANDPSDTDLAERKRFQELGVACIKESLAVGYPQPEKLPDDEKLNALNELPEFQTLFAK